MNASFALRQLPHETGIDAWLIQRDSRLNSGINLKDFDVLAGALRYLPREALRKRLAHSYMARV
jgi:hypothetical protein